jgi:hypothetical protein
MGSGMAFELAPRGVAAAVFGRQDVAGATAAGAGIVSATTTQSHPALVALASPAEAYLADITETLGEAPHGYGRVTVLTVALEASGPA